MLNDGYTFRDHVPDGAAGLTVLDYYAGRWTRHHDRDGWHACIVAGQVTCDGRTVRPDQAVLPGQVLEYRRPPWDEPDVRTDFTMLFQDDWMMAFDKPAGLPVTPGAGCQEHTLLMLARRRHDPKLSPVHRLDVGTSGVTVFARTSAAARHLCRSLRERRAIKSYLALVQGVVGPETLQIDTAIGPVPCPPLGFVSGARPDGRPSSSQARVLRRGAAATLVEVRPLTGRPQQVRIHLAAVGHPLVGDPMYAAGGLPRPWHPGLPVPLPGDGGFLLHAWRIELPHPGGGERVEIVAPPPAGLT